MTTDLPEVGARIRVTHVQVPPAPDVFEGVVASHDHLTGCVWLTDGTFVAVESGEAWTVTVEVLDPALPEESDAYIWVHPGRLGGKPCIGGTRLSVDTVTRYVKGGGGIQTAQTAHPELTRTQVLLACWYAATSGDAPEWAAWVQEHGGTLWRGAFDEVPEPTELCPGCKRTPEQGRAWPADGCAADWHRLMRTPITTPAVPGKETVL